MLLLQVRFWLPIYLCTWLTDIRWEFFPLHYRIGFEDRLSCEVLKLGSSGVGSSSSGLFVSWSFVWLVGVVHQTNRKNNQTWRAGARSLLCIGAWMIRDGAGSCTIASQALYKVTFTRSQGRYIRCSRVRTFHNRAKLTGTSTLCFVFCNSSLLKCAKVSRHKFFKQSFETSNIMKKWYRSCLVNLDEFFCEARERNWEWAPQVRTGDA